MHKAVEITLFTYGRCANEAETHFGALMQACPTAEVTLYNDASPDSPAGMATPAARFVFDDGSELWLTGHLDDVASVRRALAWNRGEDTSNHG